MEKERVQVIETPRLILRRLAFPPSDTGSSDKWTRDVEFFNDLRTDYETAKWGFDGVMDRDIAETEKYVRTRVDIAWSFIIELKESHGVVSEQSTTGSSIQKPRHTGVEGRQILGALGVRLPEENAKHADKLTQPMLGFIMHPDSRGRGYVTEATKGLLTAFWRRVDQLKEEGVVYDWTGIEALTDTENAASKRVLEKCGFKYLRTWDKVFHSKLLDSERDCFHYRLDRPMPWTIEISTTPGQLTTTSST